MEATSPLRLRHSVPLPTLYLDFDGVLHPGHARSHERFSCQNHLIDAIKGFDLEIVVSSSWRFHYTMAKLREVLHDEIGRRIVGITGDPVIGSYSRWREIERHAMFNRVKNFKALDDSTFLFPSDFGALIACDGTRGMGAAQSRAIRDWLENASS